VVGVGAAGSVRRRALPFVVLVERVVTRLDGGVEIGRGREDSTGEADRVIEESLVGDSARTVEPIKARVHVDAFARKAGVRPAVVEHDPARMLVLRAVLE